MIDLSKLLETDGQAIGAALDAATHEERLAALYSLDRKGQRKLYQLAQGGAGNALGLSHLVPEERPPRAPVRHFGRNTLPLPGKHRFFEKRFCKPEQQDARLFGYNEAPSRGLVGPGYFVALPTKGNAAWEARGGVVVDYFQVPDAAVAEGWPKVVPNTKGIQRFVYNGTRDYLRGVSKHACIGAAYKGEKALDHYFILCREP